MNPWRSPPESLWGDAMAETLIDLRHIFKTYGEGGKMPVPVLEDVTLQVEAGEYLAIMGPSGSGKSTLMNLIGCLDLPTEGAFFLGGEDVLKMNENAVADLRNRMIGFVFQNFNLLPRETALENVALPLLYAGVSRRERLARAKEALEAVGLGDRMDFLPTQLSGGQKQRVAIARAMINHPRVLLADEPTGALDTLSGKQVMELFDALNAGGITFVMITHAPEIAQRARRVIRILDGKFAGEGGAEV